MKKIILFAAILFAGVSVVNAQIDLTNGGAANTITEQARDEVTLQVKLNNFQYIQVNNSDPVVLEYTSIESFATGVSSDVLGDHLSVSSTGGFTVKVEAQDLTLKSDDNLTSTSTKTIEASTIKILAAAGTNSFTSIIPGNDVFLSSTPSVLISSVTGGIDRNINITYGGAGLNKYVENFTGGESGPAIYETTVYYSIEPK